MDANRIILTCLLACLFLAGCGVGEPLFEVLDGNYRYFSGDYTGATVSYIRALEYGKFEDFVHYDLGNVYSALGEKEPAMDELGLAVTDEKTDEELAYRAHFNLGNIYFELSDYRKAVFHFKNALRAKSKDLDAKINLELAIRKMKQDEAVNKSRMPEEKTGQGSVEPFTQDVLKDIQKKEKGIWRKLHDQKRDQKNVNDW
ncbi:MAG: tetratricopeptide repeat protein [Spirochaetales bacterium]|nr:tetratricopeptide repeat protein [Spirochaetales bacterium]